MVPPRRNRCFWSNIDGRPLDDYQWLTPEGFEISRRGDGEHTVKYVGAKPAPSSLAVARLFCLPRDAKEVVQNPGLAMQTFTHEFYHHYEPEHARYSS